MHAYCAASSPRPEARDTSVLPEAPHLAHRDIILLLTNGNDALDRFHVFVTPHF